MNLLAKLFTLLFLPFLHFSCNISTSNYNYHKFELNSADSINLEIYWPYTTHIRTPKETANRYHLMDSMKSAELLVIYNPQKRTLQDSKQWKKYFNKINNSDTCVIEKRIDLHMNKINIDYYIKHSDKKLYTYFKNMTMVMPHGELELHFNRTVKGDSFAIKKVKEELNAMEKISIINSNSTLIKEKSKTTNSEPLDSLRIRKKTINIDDELISCQIDVPWPFNYIPISSSNQFSYVNNSFSSFNFKDTVNNASLEVEHYYFTSPFHSNTIEKEFDNWCYLERGLLKKLHRILLLKEFDVNNKKYSRRDMLIFPNDGTVRHWTRFFFYRTEGFFSINYSQSIPLNNLDYYQLISELNLYKNINISVTRRKQKLVQLLEKSG